MQNHKQMDTLGETRFSIFKTSAAQSQALPAGRGVLAGACPYTKSGKVEYLQPYSSWTRRTLLVEANTSTTA